MTVLFQVKTGEIKLVDGLGVLWRQGCLSGIGYRTDVIGLGTPLQQWEHTWMLGTVDGEVQVLQLNCRTLDRFR